MAENINDLILTIGADVSTFEKSIKEVKDAIKKLKDVIDTTPFNLVKPEQIQQLKGLEKTLETLQSRVSQTSFNQFTNSSKDARIATNSLNLVLQDLPFGFIGIQNNLPALFNSFKQLREEAKGTSGAFSLLINELKGPAGLFLAFTAVSTIVTMVVQKYGSLANAYDKLFTSTSNATIAQREYNDELKEGGKNLGSELSKVELLTKGISNENSTREERLNYFYQAKKEIPSLLAGLTEENVLTKAGIKILQANSSARKSFLDLQVKQQAIGKVLNTNYSEEADIQAKLLEQEKKRDSALKSKTDNQEKLNKATDPKLIKVYNLILKQANKEFDFSIIAISRLKDELGKLQIVQSNYSDDLDEIIKGSGEYEKNQSRLIEGLKKEEESSKNAAKAARDLAKARAEQFRFAGDIRSLRNPDFLDFDPTLKPIKKIDTKAYIESFNKSLSEAAGANVAPLVNVLFPEDEFKKLSDIWSKINADTAPKLEEFKNNIRDALINKELTTGVKTTYDDVQKAITDAISKLQTLLGDDAKITQNFANAIMSGANEFTRLEQKVKDFDKLKSSIESNLQRPFRDFFDDLLENGKVSFDGFVQLAKDALKRIAAQVIAAGLAQLLASIINPAGAAATVGAAKGGGIFEIFKNILGIKSVAAPSFGGVESGGMQLAGAVNLQLRGSDLVGSINRTNSTINRVG